jgi:hypothetical protein
MNTTLADMPYRFAQVMNIRQYPRTDLLAPSDELCGAAGPASRQLDSLGETRYNAHKQC